MKSEIIQNCPINCRCDLTRGRVFCHNRGFIRIPKNIPPDTKTLNLQDNQLENSAELDRKQLLQTEWGGFPIITSVLSLPQSE